jgi:hypothetical protein
MSDVEVPRTSSNLAPGMNLVVIAGQYYTITDINGNDTGVEGRDDPLTLAFIHAYDEWHTAMKFLGGMGSPQERSARYRLDQMFEALPKRIKDDLPSRRSGLVIPGR